MLTKPCVLRPRTANSGSEQGKHHHYAKIHWSNLVSSVDLFLKVEKWDATNNLFWKCSEPLLMAFTDVTDVDRIHRWNLMGCRNSSRPYFDWIKRRFQVRTIVIKIIWVHNPFKFAFFGIFLQFYVGLEKTNSDKQETN